jgi:urease accessory protein
VSTTRVAVAVAGARPRVTTSVDGAGSGGRLQPRQVRADAGWARVALVADGALLLAGDTVRLVVQVDADARLELVEPSGTVAYAMRGGCARWEVRVRLGPGALLVWHGQPFVAAQGSDVQRTVAVELSAGALLAQRETLVLGRSGEGPGRLSTTTRVTLDGRPLLAEDLDLRPDRPRVGVLGDHRVVDTVSLLGVRAPEVEAAGTELALAGPGTLWRSLTREAHQSPLDPVWAQVGAWGRAWVRAAVSR